METEADEPPVGINAAEAWRSMRQRLNKRRKTRILKRSRRNLVKRHALN
jgi:hypothetical protein